MTQPTIEEVRAAFLETFEEMELIISHYHPEGRHEDDLSLARQVINKHKALHTKLEENLVAKQKPETQLKD